MKIAEVLKQKKMSVYRLSKESGVPYSTVSDIVQEKTSLKQCNAETVYKLAEALQMDMKLLLRPYIEERCGFEAFKSNVCHKLKEMGDIDYVTYLLEQDLVGKYYKKKWFPECFYTLGMMDYLSRVNSIPLCGNYNKLRQLKLEKVIYPMSIEALHTVSGNEQAKEEAIKKAIPEFLKFNIVECEVRSAI